MGLFFTSPESSIDTRVRPMLVEALTKEKIVDSAIVAREIERLLATQEPAKPAKVKPFTVLVAVGILIVVFYLATFFEGSTASPKASETLYRCFELGFTATLGLFGIEA